MRRFAGREVVLLESRRGRRAFPNGVNIEHQTIQNCQIYNCISGDIR